LGGNKHQNNFRNEGRGGVNSYSKNRQLFQRGNGGNGNGNPNGNGSLNGNANNSSGDNGHGSYSSNRNGGRDRFWSSKRDMQLRRVEFEDRDEDQN